MKKYLIRVAPYMSTPHYEEVTGTPLDYEGLAVVKLPEKGYSIIDVATGLNVCKTGVIYGNTKKLLLERFNEHLNDGVYNLSIRIEHARQTNIYKKRVKEMLEFRQKAFINEL